MIISLTVVELVETVAVPSRIVIVDRSRNALRLRSEAVPFQLVIILYYTTKNNNYLPKIITKQSIFDTDN
jgi:hypothetical protein